MDLVKQRARQRRWWEANREKVRVSNRRWKRRNAEQVNKAARARRAEIVQKISELKTHPCTDCGGIFDPVCMDFDHLPGQTKTSGGVARLLAIGITVEKIMEEIQKCDLVCANCHRLRTKKRSANA